jgi:arginine decarboxylase
MSNGGGNHHRNGHPNGNAQDHTWNVQDAVSLYNIDNWGSGYFGINEQGNISVAPTQDKAQTVDLTEILQEAKSRGLGLPLLVRFQDLLRHRVESINETFRAAIAENNYQGRYMGVFPIKVNQLREVVEEIIDAGRPFNHGLEVGSKPELFAALAVHQDPESLIICNGYKDPQFIRTALLGRRLGKKVILVVEKIEEISHIIAVSKEFGVEPLIGMRVRLHAKSSGKWALSGGENAKFGLTTAELLEAIDILHQEKLGHCLKLLHFHIGSQIPDIATVKKAVREATRYYAKLRQLDCAIEFLDVGGGLAVDYDGSRSSFDSSMNYSLAEYTSDVVYNIMDICDAEKVPHPHIVSESGRATVSHHSVLILDVFGSIQKNACDLIIPEKDDIRIVQKLFEIRNGLNKRTRRESLHDTKALKEEAQSMFDLGLMNLKMKAKVEKLFWQIATQIAQLYQGTRVIPEEVKELENHICDQYVCNFSVFQSLLDHWALGQLFPIVPIHRLNEQPTRNGILVDITCDSDGKI